MEQFEKPINQFEVRSYTKKELWPWPIFPTLPIRTSPPTT